jgi:hypothetical protein
MESGLSFHLELIREKVVIDAGDNCSTFPPSPPLQLILGREEGGGRGTGLEGEGGRYSLSASVQSFSRVLIKSAG